MENINSDTSIIQKENNNLNSNINNNINNVVNNNDKYNIKSIAIDIFNKYKYQLIIICIVIIIYILYKYNIINLDIINFNNKIQQKDKKNTSNLLLENENIWNLESEIEKLIKNQNIYIQEKKL